MTKLGSLVSSPPEFASAFWSTNLQIIPENFFHNTINSARTSGLEVSDGCLGAFHLSLSLLLGRKLCRGTYDDTEFIHGDPTMDTHDLKARRCPCRQTQTMETKMRNSDVELRHLAA
jgi:hypothetical protein